MLCPLVKDSEGFDATCPTIPAIASPVITGIKGPQSLNVNQQGTWTITAYDKNGGNLSYSVDWGDNPATPGFSVQHTSPLSQQNATFTHSYSRSGTYTPKFYVQNENGKSAQTSLSVNVGNTTTPSSITVLSPNGGESWQKGTKQTIKWLTLVTTKCPEGVYCGSDDKKKTYDLKLVPFSYEPPCSVGIPCTTSPTTVRAPYIIAQRVSGSSHSWSVGKIIDSNTIIPDGSYTVQVCQSGTNTCDSSDSYFKIVSETANISPKIVGIPAIPANIQVGQTVNFSWSATDANNDDLSWSLQVEGPTGGSGGVGFCPIPHGQNRARWTYNASQTFDNAGTYKITATVSDCAGGSDSNSFTVQVGNVTTPSITVLSPNGGEVWPVDSTQVIKWNNTFGGPVNLTLSNYPACWTTEPVCSAPAVLYQLANNLYGSNYFWTTGKTASGGNIPAGEYKVTISSATNGSVTDQSDSAFTITAPTTTSNTLDLSASAYSRFLLSH